MKMDLWPQFVLLYHEEKNWLQYKDQWEIFLAPPGAKNQVGTKAAQASAQNRLDCFGNYLRIQLMKNIWPPGSLL
jgi:hypothetical protein